MSSALAFLMGSIFTLFLLWLRQAPQHAGPHDGRYHRQRVWAILVEHWGLPHDWAWWLASKLPSTLLPRL